MNAAYNDCLNVKVFYIKWLEANFYSIVEQYNLKCLSNVNTLLTSTVVLYIAFWVNKTKGSRSDHDAYCVNDGEHVRDTNVWVRLINES